MQAQFLSSYGYGGSRVHSVDDSTIAYICGKGVKFLNIVTGEQRYFWPEVFYENLYTTTNVDLLEKLQQRNNRLVDEYGPSVQQQKSAITSMLPENNKFNGSTCVAIAFNKHAQLFAIAEKSMNPKIHIYDYQFKRLQVLSGGASLSFCDLCFSRDGEWLLSLSTLPDHRIILWHWKTANKISESPGAIHSHSISFNPRDKNQFCTSGASHLAFWQVNQNADGYEISPEEPKVSERIYEQIKDDESYCHSWGPNGELFCGTTGGFLLSFSSIFESGVLLDLQESREPINSMTLSKHHLILGLDDGLLRLYALNKLTSRVSGSYSSRSQRQALLHDALHSQVTVSDTSDAEILNVCMSGDFKSILAGTADGSLYSIFLDSYEKATSTSQELRSSNNTIIPIVDAHMGPITGLEHLPTTIQSDHSFSHDLNSSILVTCGSDGSLRCWNYKTNHLVAKKQFEAHFTCLSCALSGRTVFLGSNTGYLRVVDLEVDMADDSFIPRLQYCKKIRRSSIKLMKCGGVNSALLALVFEDNFIAIVRSNKDTKGIEDNDVVDFDLSIGDEYSYGEQYSLLGFIKFSTGITTLSWTQQHQLYVATESSELYLITPPIVPSDNPEMLFSLSSVTQNVWKLDYTSHGLAVFLENHKSIFSIAQDKSLKYYQLSESTRSNTTTASSEVESHLKLAKCITFSPNYRFIATGGGDGVVWIRKNSVNLDEQANIMKENMHSGDALFFLKHNSNEGGVSSICFSPDQNFLFSAGFDGSVCVFSLRDSVRYDTPVFRRVYHNSAPKDRKEEKWLSIHEDVTDATLMETSTIEQERVERVLNETQKEALKQQVEQLQAEFEALKQENELAPEDERLNDEEFIIDHEYLKVMDMAAQERVKSLEKETTLENYRKEILASRIKEECWDTMETHQITLNSFYYMNNNIGASSDQPKPVRVANFVIRKPDVVKDKLVQKLRFLRRVEEVTLRSRRKECVTGNLEGGVPVDDYVEEESGKNNSSVTPQKNSRRLSMDARSDDTAHLSDNDDDQLLPFDDRNQGYYERDKSLRTTTTSQRKFETAIQTRERVLNNLEKEDRNLKYDPLDLYTKQRKITQIQLIKSEIRQTMIEFNKKFDSTKDQKAKVIQKIGQINEKIEEIVFELNKSQKNQTTASEFTYEPEIPKSEVPESILTVTIDDMPFKERYVSPEELAKREEAHRLEQERLQKEQSGNAAERALMMMMDGKLDIEDESVSEFDIPPPTCYNKEESELTDAEIKEIKEYEIKRKQKEEEREKQIKQLEAKLQNAQLQIRDLCMNFDRSLHSLFQDKLVVDESIYKMELTIIKLAQSIIYHDEAYVTELQLQNIVNELKTKKAASANSLQEYKKKLEMFTNEYKQLVTEDKNFEESSKSDFAKLIGTAAAQQMLIEVAQPQVPNQASPRVNNPLNSHREAQNPSKFIPSDKEILDRLHKLFRNRPKLKPQAALDIEIANRSEDMLDPFADIDIAWDIKYTSGQDIIDYQRDKPPFLSQYVWDEFWKMRQMKISSDREIRETKQKLEIMNQQLERMKREDDNLNHIMTTNMTDLNNFRAKIIRESYNLDKLFTLKQGQVEVEQAAVVTDYSDAILISKSIIQNYNQSIRAHAQENIKQMHKSKDVLKKIKKTQWENELIQFETDDMLLKHTELQMTKVTKRMQQLIKGGGSEKQKALEQSRLRNQIQHTQSNLQLKMEERGKAMRKIDALTQSKEQENAKLRTQLELLQQLVEERGSLHKLQATTREKEQMDAKMKELRWERRLKEQIKNQDEEHDRLKNEIDRLRRRSFPVFAIVQRRRIGGD